VPLNLAAVYLYNRFLPRLGPVKMVASVAFATVAINFLCAAALPLFPKLIFFQFAWKDIYILLMFKQLWSMIHSTIPSSRAKYLYGAIFGMGTLGSILGSAVPSFLAVSLGSEAILFFTLPLYAAILFAFRNAYARSLVPKESFGKDLTLNPKPSEAISLIRRNGFLAGVLLLVVFMQVSVALQEYRFNAHLEMNILEKDLRTAYCGKLMGLMNVLSGSFQIGGGFLMVHLLGLKRSHFAIPLLLLGSGLFSWAVPTFFAISCSYVFLKSIDFSLFAVLREMLYIPLKLDEKYRAKAIIDVFAYRTSKALVSLAILLLQALAGVYLLDVSTYVSFAVFAAWMGVVVFMFRNQPASQPA
jgi:ATP/ADP translocase